MEENKERSILATLPLVWMEISLVVQKEEWNFLVLTY